MPYDADVIVVGASLAGLATAARLGKQRHRVLLVEATDQLGGSWAPRDLAGTTVDDLPPVLTFPAPWRDLFRKCGRPLEAELERAGLALAPAPAPTYTKVERLNDTSAGIGGHIGSAAGLQFYDDELRVTNQNYTAYRTIRASGFTVASSSTVKQDLSDIHDPLGTLLAAPSRRWRYVAHEADEEAWHYGPMLEDLPKEMDRGGAVDIDAKVGLLWAAVAQLAQELRC